MHHSDFVYVWSVWFGNICGRLPARTQRSQWQWTCNSSPCLPRMHHHSRCNVKLCDVILHQGSEYKLCNVVQCNSSPCLPRMQRHCGCNVIYLSLHCDVRKCILRLYCGARNAELHWPHFHLLAIDRESLIGAAIGRSQKQTKINTILRSDGQS